MSLPTLAPILIPEDIGYYIRVEPDIKESRKRKEMNEQFRNEIQTPRLKMKRSLSNETKSESLSPSKLSRSQSEDSKQESGSEHEMIYKEHIIMRSMEGLKTSD